MRRYPLYLFFLLFLASGNARTQEQMTSIALTGSITTSPKLYPHPDDPDDLFSGQFLPLGAAYGGGIDIRRLIPSLRLWLGLSVEFIANAKLFLIPYDAVWTIPVRDGYVVVPVELSAYFPIPVGGEKLLWTIGGGGGGYFGSRRYRYGTAESETVDRSPGYGIHVLTDIEYAVSPPFSLRTEAKFRSIHFDSVDKFPEPWTVVGGQIVAIPSAPARTRVIADGISVSLQLVWHF
jgi:hypothetical protein